VEAAAHAAVEAAVVANIDAIEGSEKLRFAAQTLADAYEVRFATQT